MANPMLIRLLRSAVSIADQIADAQGINKQNNFNVYPAELSRDIFQAESRINSDLSRFDTVVEWSQDGHLVAVPYHQKYRGYFHQLADVLGEAAALTDQIEFKEYLLSAVNCFTIGTQESYRQMMTAWLKTRDCPLCFLVVYDETYSDTFMGLKGSFDAALFEQDTKASQTVEITYATWRDFCATLTYPGTPEKFYSSHAGVYSTLALGGSLPAMQLRAWNLPNDYGVRKQYGSHQIIIKENTENSFLKDLQPMIRNHFEAQYSSMDSGELYRGLLSTLAAHELGHNLGCYGQQQNLFSLEDTFEELKANIYPLLWLCFCREAGNLTDSEAESAAFSYIALDLMDCKLARTTPSRSSYCLATQIQLHYLMTRGAVQISNNRLKLDFSKFEEANLGLLQSVLSVLSSGDYEFARSFAQEYSGTESLQKFIKSL